MDWNLKTTITSDFEKYMLLYHAKFNRFSFEEFADYAASMINYYKLNQDIDQSQKYDIALYLTNLYSKGLGNIMTEEHKQQLANLIAVDESLNFTIINEIK